MPASYGSYSSQIAPPPRQITIIQTDHYNNDTRARESQGGAVGEDLRMKSPQCEGKVVKEHTPKIEVSVS